MQMSNKINNTNEKQNGFAIQIQKQDGFAIELETRQVQDANEQ